MMCVCCDHALKRIGIRDEFSGAPLGGCSHCGHVQVTVVPTSEQLARYYQEKYTASRGQYVDAKYLAVMKRRAVAQCEFIERCGISLAGARVADVGCGYGELLVALQQRGAQVVGFEYDPACVRYCRSRGLELEQLTSEHDLDQLAHFDLITLSHTLEHMRDLPFALRTLTAKTRAVFIEVPRYEIDLTAMFRDQEGHLHFFAPGSLQALLDRMQRAPERLVSCGPDLDFYWRNRYSLVRRAARLATRDWFFGDYGTARPGGMWIRSLTKVHA
jgi:SAM-dependent methyltransferase